MGVFAETGGAKLGKKPTKIHYLCSGKKRGGKVKREVKVDGDKRKNFGKM